MQGLVPLDLIDVGIGLAGVSYLIAPEANLAFGEAENKYQISFEEKNTGGTAMFEMLMKGMAASGNKDVQEQMKDRLG